ncbi:MAG: metallophosphoesterase [Candidatus Dormibacteria bacterium]
MSRTAVLGDIHGDFERMLELVGAIPNEVPLVLVGDYFDRWPQAMEVVRWAMQRPNLTALLGNHDILVLGVLAEERDGGGGRCTETWLYNGGQTEDLRRLQADPAAVEWLCGLPAMTRVGEVLIQHCDAPVYLLYGTSPEEVNAAITRRLRSFDADAIFGLFEHLCRRREFYSPKLLHQYLDAFGARALVHGHTPHTAPQAMTLFKGGISNVDGALSRGFGAAPRGFVHWLDEA